ncbi:unnamed protein product [Orchesella dallaii]|uniref:Uncharacterized protein n=1 Tax=Orchesella dallaii TaxID=48710 RepID=A0ABP1QM50_9HEXA
MQKDDSSPTDKAPGLRSGKPYQNVVDPKTLVKHRAPRKVKTADNENTTVSPQATTSSQYSGSNVERSPITTASEGQCADRLESQVNETSRHIDSPRTQISKLTELATSHVASVSKYFTIPNKYSREQFLEDLAKRKEQREQQVINTEAQETQQTTSVDQVNTSEMDAAAIQALVNESVKEAIAQENDNQNQVQGQPRGGGYYRSRPYSGQGRGEDRGRINPRRPVGRGGSRRREIPTVFDREVTSFTTPPSQDIITQLRTLPDDLKKHIEWVRTNIQNIQAKNKEYYDRRHIAHPFKSGDKVLIKNHARSDKAAHKIQKLLRKWIGPFVLGAQAEDNDVTFEILTIPHLKRVGQRHVNDLRPYVERKTVKRRLITSPDVEDIDDNELEEPTQQQVLPPRRARTRLDYRTLAGYKTKKKTNDRQ